MSRRVQKESAGIMSRITPKSMTYQLYRRGFMSKHTFFAFLYEYFMSKLTHKGGCHFRAEVYQFLFTRTTHNNNKNPDIPPQRNERLFVAMLTHTQLIIKCEECAVTHNNALGK